MPDHLQSDFQRRLGKEVDLAGGGDTDFATWDRMNAATLCERGVIVAGDPDSCIEGVKRHQEAGADQLILVMQTDQVPHEKVMSSIDLFGRRVIPAFAQ